MFKNLRLAAIDVGSNAVRMVICDYTPKGFHFLEKFRFPIRLGSDVFENGKISGKNLKESARTFRKFSQLMKRYKVQEVRAVGTSALREAKNQTSFVELVKRSSGIQLEVIDGLLEAELITLAIQKEVHLENHSSLLVDIGGGSVEFTLSDHGKILRTESHPMGTVRILEQMKKRSLSEKQLPLVMGEFVPTISEFLKHRPHHKLDFAVGTGGNIEAFGKLKTLLLKKENRSFVSLVDLLSMIEKIERVPIKERESKLKLRPDRADVILPALHLVVTTLQLSMIDQIYIPYVGLKDGLLWSIIQKVSDAEASAAPRGREQSGKSSPLRGKPSRFF